MTESCKPPPNSSPNPHVADEDRVARLVHRLGRRYSIVLAVVAVLVLVDQAVLQPMLVRLAGYAPLINLAGRQRMLSQKITKTALNIERRLPPHSDTLQRGLQQDLAEWEQVHLRLQWGNASPGLPGTDSREIIAAFEAMESSYVGMRDPATRIAEWHASESEFERDRIAANDLVDALLGAETQYLSQMDRTVKLFEAQASAQVARLRWLGLSITGAVLALLIGLGSVVVRPASAVIRRQLEELASSRRLLRVAYDQMEVRVAERTRQLSETNEALRLEMEERQRAEEQARQTLTQLAQVARGHAVGQLATGLAHELNQPLGAIATSADTAELVLERESPDINSAKGALRRIRDSALRAGAIIRRMRNFLRPAARVRTIVSLNALVAEVVEFCGPECRNAEVSVVVDMSTESPLVEVDPIQIQQVLVNLIQNAIHALSDVPADARQLTLKTQRVENLATVVVEDTGPGFTLDPDAAFTVLTSSRPDGLGMGLSISRSILHDHCGSIQIDTAPRHGARIQFTLPLSSSHDVNSWPSDPVAADSVCR